MNLDHFHKGMKQISMNFKQEVTGSLPLPLENHRNVEVEFSTGCSGCCFSQ